MQRNRPSGRNINHLAKTIQSPGPRCLGNGRKRRTGNQTTAGMDPITIIDSSQHQNRFVLTHTYLYTKMKRAKKSKPDTQSNTEENTAPNDYLSRIEPVDVGRALNLRLDNKLSYQKIATILGCAKSSVWFALKPFLQLIENPQQVEAYRDNKPVLLNALEMRLATEMLDAEKLKSASLNNVAYAFGQVSQQAHLAAGEATQNIQYHQLIAQAGEIDAGIEALDAEIAIIEMGN